MGKNCNNNDTKIDEKESQMEFTLFRKISFKINNPLTLIEAYCIQNNFYRNYDIVQPRTIQLVSQIGGRPNFDVIRAQRVVNKYRNLELLRLDIDTLFNQELDVREQYITDFVNGAISSLDNLHGIALPVATKIYHTLYPEIIPMIDNPLKEEYIRIKGITRRQLQFDKLFIDYYKTFKSNKENINKLYGQLSSQRLTKVRIFDIIWWSFLKYKRLAADFQEIRWSTIESM